MKRYFTRKNLPLGFGFVPRWVVYCIIQVAHVALYDLPFLFIPVLKLMFDAHEALFHVFTPAANLGRVFYSRLELFGNFR